MKKRTFLLGTVAVAGALGVGWSLRPPRGRLLPDTPVAPRPGDAIVNGWLRITTDDRVIVQVPKSEMGQGILTAVAMVVADELDADWSRVSTEHPPPDPIYFNTAMMVDGLPLKPPPR